MIKVGDRVKIINNTSSHNYPMNSIVRITRFDGETYRGIIEGTNREGNNFYERDCEKLNDPYRKALLETFVSPKGQELMEKGVLKISIELSPEAYDKVMEKFLTDGKDVILKTF